jgi:hypothetical protein
VAWRPSPDASGWKPAAVYGAALAVVGELRLLPLAHCSAEDWAGIAVEVLERRARPIPEHQSATQAAQAPL